MSGPVPVARALVAMFRRHRVRRMYGVPGGGSSLDLIAEGAAAGIDFVLARTETAGLIMAAVDAEPGGTLGAALTTKGPGVAHGANGVAYAALDRAPIVVVTDGFTAAHQAYVTHQAFDQRALLARLALTPPHGPVHVELASAAARRAIEPAPAWPVPPAPAPDGAALAEAACVGQADLIVLAGLDPVELIPQPWRYAAPVVDVALVRHPVHYVRPAASLHGPRGPSLAALAEGAGASARSPAEIGGHRERMRAELACPGDEVSPQAVVELAREVVGAREPPRVAVDAGAHLFSVMAFWQAAQPCDVLISNGLATMAFALPAAVAAGLHEPGRRVLAFTGDGGLLMCLGELATAAQHRAPVTVVVFNDGSLSLIDIKQRERRLDPRGVRWGRPDFARVAEGLGLGAWRVDTPAACRAALSAALDADGPTLVDVLVDPSGYPDQIRALRG